MMEKEYYIHRNGSEEGPYTRRELLDRRAQGSIPLGCYIWREGMAEWKPFYQVFPTGPLSVPPAPCPGSVEGCGESGASKPWWKKSLSMGEASLILGGASFLIFVMVALLPPESSGTLMALISVALGVMATGSAFAVLIAIVLGVVSLCRREGKVVFAVFGIVLSVLTIAMIR